MDNVCNELHQICSKLPRFTYNDLENKTLTKNGIYIVFEEGEKAHGTDRIVRIGTHTGQGNLILRLKEHFLKEKKDRSIFRKNIGRAILAKSNDPYLEIWNRDLIPSKNRKKHRNNIDEVKQENIEKMVSDYIRNNFSFSILSIEDAAERLELEAKLIGTVSICEECNPSKSWLGLKSPEEKIRSSGLWQKQHLRKKQFDTVDIKKFKKLI